MVLFARLIAVVFSLVPSTLAQYCGNVLRCDLSFIGGSYSCSSGCTLIQVGGSYTCTSDPSGGTFTIVGGGSDCNPSGCGCGWGSSPCSKNYQLSCPAGFFVSGSSQSFCTVTQPNTCCFSTDPNRYSFTKQQSCQRCPANTYASGSGSRTSCTSCPAGQTSPTGSTSSSACSAPAVGTCQLCAATASGYWCPGPDTCLTSGATCTYGLIGSPTNCGTYPSLNNNCQTCAGGPGYYCPTESGLAPNGNQIGICYNSATSGSCATPTIAYASDCVYSCPAGRYNSRSAPTDRFCDQCPANTYSLRGATACTACPGTATSPAGSTSSSACVVIAFSCAAGSYNPTGGASASACMACPANTFYGGGIASSCTACAAGLTAPTGSTNATACRSSTPYTCTPGYYNSDGGFTVASCVQCAANTYSGAVGATTCTPCPGSTVAPVGSTSSAACVAGPYACPAGTRNSDGGTTAASCSQCPAGTYAPPTSALCTPCPVGQVSPVGSASAAACVSSAYSCVAGDCYGNDGALNGNPRVPWWGQQQPTLAACQALCDSVPTLCFSVTFSGGNCYPKGNPATCATPPPSSPPAYSGPSVYCTKPFVCPAGHASGLATSPPLSACAQCPANTYAPAGSATCTPCAPGLNTVPGSADCTPPYSCPAGKYNPSGEDTASACLTCPRNSTCAAGASAPSPCAAGLVAPPGSSACYYSCAVGSANPSGGATAAACQSCPVNTFGATGSRACAPCNTGFTAPTSALLCSPPQGAAVLTPYDLSRDLSALGSVTTSLVPGSPPLTLFSQGVATYAGNFAYLAMLVPPPGHSVTLRFTAFNTGEDAVTVALNNANYTVLASLTGSLAGSSLPPLITAPMGEQVSVQLLSFGGGGQPGFTVVVGLACMSSCPTPSLSPSSSPSTLPAPLNGLASSTPRGGISAADATAAAALPIAAIGGIVAGAVALLVLVPILVIVCCCGGFAAVCATRKGPFGNGHPATTANVVVVHKSNPLTHFVRGGWGW